MRIRLLGDIEAIGDDGGVMAISASKPRRLLALLALRAGRMATLDAIIDDLWGDAPPSSATNLVQGYISDLRKLIGPSLIRTTPGGYLLDVDPGAIDVSEFEQLVAAAFAASPLDPAKAVDLVAGALDLWLGQPFGERLADGQLGAAAAGLVERRLEAIELGIRCELAVGRHDGLTSRLEQLIADHPYREGLWCSLAVVLYRVDRQADALKRIHDARTMLAEELGVLPGADLVEIERQILNHDRRLQPSSTADTLHSRAQTVVGRLDEFARLDERLGQVRAGAQKVIFIGGEPGIGKTTVARTLAAKAAARGAIVLLGRCDEHLAVPYRPFVEAITDHLRTLDPSEVDELIGERGNDVVAILPSVKPLLTTSSDAKPSTDISLLVRFELFRWLLRQIGGTTPTILILDDVHWADSASLRLMHYLNSGQRLPSFLTLATYRTTEPAELLDDILADLRAEPQVERMTLTGLSVQELRSLIGDGSDAVDLAEWVHYETDGNPFLAAEVIAHVNSTGSRVGLPDGVSEVVGRRLRRLSPPAYQLLERAAILGDSAPLSLLRNVASEIPGVSAALSELTGRGILTEEESSERHYRFTHAIIRAAVTATMNSLEREDRHVEAALAWARLPRTSDSVLAVAAHYQAAGSAAPAEAATAAFTEAGAVSDDSGAKVEAVQWYDRSLALLSADDPRHRSVRLTRFVAAQAAWHWHFGDHRRAGSG